MNLTLSLSNFYAQYKKFKENVETIKRYGNTLVRTMNANMDVELRIQLLQFV